MLKYQTKGMVRPATNLLWLLIFSASLLLPSSTLWAQSNLGQYTEEAPLGTWNIFGVNLAPSLGLGLNQSVLNLTSAASLTNPALLSFLPATTLSLNLSFSQDQLAKYWLVNTGVLTTNGNLYCRNWQFDYLGISQRFGKWTVAMAVAVTEDYSRPKVDYRLIYQQTLSHQLVLWQKGCQRNYVLGFSRNLNSSLAAGLSLVLRSGHIERNLEETWPVDGIQMTDNRYQKIRGFYVVFGLSYRVRDWLTLGLSLILPSVSKVSGQSQLTYKVPETQTNIEILGQAQDRTKKPMVAGVGAKFSLRPNLDYYLEGTYFDWANYAFSYFGEPLERNFRKVIRLGTGLEYRTRLKFLGRIWSTPYYLGFLWDPQPMTEVNSNYFYLTFGSGLCTDFISLSFSTAIGLETGSGQHLKNQKIAITLELYPGAKKNRGRRTS